MRRFDRWKGLAALLALAAAAYFWGLGWNLPSTERADLVVPPAQRTGAFIARVAAERQKIYWKYASELANVAAEFEAGRRDKPEPAQMSEENLWHYYSGYLIRSGQEDEPRILVAFSNIKPAQLQFNPHLFLYGGPLVYPAGAAVFIGAKVLGMAKLVPDITFYYEHPDEMARVFWLMRAWGALLAVGVAAALFLGLDTAEGSRFAWVSAALFAFCPAVVTGAHTLKPHLPMCAFVLASVLCALRRLRSGEPRWTLYAGLWAGLAMGTSLSGLVCWFFVAPMQLWASRPDRRSAASGWLKTFLAPELWAAGAASVAVYFLVNPYILVSWDEYLHDTFLIARYGGGFGANGLDPLCWLWVPLRFGLGPALWAATLAAVAWLTFRGGAEDRLLVLGTVASLAWVAGTAGQRWCIPQYARVLLPVELMMVFLLDRGLNRLASRGRALAAQALAAALLAGTAPLAVAYDVRYGQDTPATSNMMQAGRWIVAHVPAGASVGIWNGYLDPEGMPPFRFAEHPVYFLTRTTPQALGTVPDFVVVGPMTVTPEWRSFLDAHYAVRERFDAPLFGGWEFHDELQSADFPVTVYARKDAP